MADALFGSVDACFLVVCECYSTFSSGTLAHSLVLLATARRHRFSWLLCAQNHTHALCRSHCRVAHNLMLLPCGLSFSLRVSFSRGFVSFLRCFFKTALASCATVLSSSCVHSSPRRTATAHTNSHKYLTRFVAHLVTNQQIWGRFCEPLSLRRDASPLSVYSGGQDTPTARLPLLVLLRLCCRGQQMLLKIVFKMVCTWPTIRRQVDAIYCIAPAAPFLLDVHRLFCLFCWHGTLSDGVLQTCWAAPCRECSWGAHLRNGPKGGSPIRTEHAIDARPKAPAVRVKGVMCTQRRVVTTTVRSHGNCLRSRVPCVFLLAARVLCVVVCQIHVVNSTNSVLLADTCERRLVVHGVVPCVRASSWCARDGKRAQRHEATNTTSMRGTTECETEASDPLTGLGPSRS